MMPLHREAISAFADCGLDVPEIENYRWWVVPLTDSQYAAYVITIHTQIVDSDPALAWKPEWNEEKGHIVLERHSEQVYVEGMFSGTFKTRHFHIGFDPESRVGVLWMDTPSLG